ncbi:MAG: hypothetical protein RIA64_16390 [Rhodospirillales bacterium]
MTFESRARLTSENDNFTAHERLRRASRALAEAVAAQQAQVKTFQNTMDALGQAVDGLENSFQQVHDSLTIPVGSKT